MRTQRLAVAYFALQGLGVAAWWLGLWLAPWTRALFFPGGALDAPLRALLLPDLLLLACGSLLAAGLRARHAQGAGACSWAVAGATAYATLFTFAWSWLVAAPPLSALLMALAAAGSLGSARVRV